MKSSFSAQYLSLKTDENGRREITFVAESRDSALIAHIAQDLRELAARGKTELEVKVAPRRKKRSLDANAALWALLGEMAAVLGTSKDELYLQMLERYGVFTHIVVKTHVAERFAREWRTVRELGEVTVNGQTGTQLQCYFGSSGYDRKEFSVLLDGVISEAREIGVYLITDAERDRMIDVWGGKEKA
jgi:hypothetical protein